MAQVTKAAQGPLKGREWEDAILFVRGATGQVRCCEELRLLSCEPGVSSPSRALTGPEGHSLQRKGPSFPSPSSQWKVSGAGLHDRHGCLRSKKKFPELPALTLNSAP